MPSNSFQSIDPHVLATWLRGWTLARQTLPPVPDHGGWRVDVGWPSQRVRYVFPEVTPDIGRLAATLTEPWTFIKVCADLETLRAVMPRRWSMLPPGDLMICNGPMRTAGTLPAGYVLDVAEAEPISVVRVLATDGAIASMGHVVQVEGFAIYDRIETGTAHRRRGLGRVVMTALEAISRSRGATDGLLVATPDGRALYESLGWTVYSPYSTAALLPPLT